jgi:hypothetical protein
LLNVVGEYAILDEVWIEVRELGDVDDFDIEVWVFKFQSSSEQAGVGGGFLEGAGDGDDVIDHDQLGTKR